MDIHIILYSFLESSGGGRETWLNNFLPELYKQTHGECNVTIYFCKNSKPRHLMKVTSNKNFKFIPFRVFEKRILAVFSLIKFIFQTTLALNKHTCKKSIVLSIGSTYELFPVLLHRLMKGKVKFIYGIWLRSISKYEIKNRRMAVISKLILKSEKYCLDLADIVISNGIDTYNYYKNTGFNSVIIPNAIDYSLYADIPELQTSPSIITVSYIGRLVKGKGIYHYLEAIRKFNRNYPQYINKIYFDVVGGGLLLNEVLKLTEKNFSYKGIIENSMMKQYLQTIHAGVALTFNSVNPMGGGGGVSNQLLELAIAGRIIITWNNLTYQQVLNSDSGIMIEEGNIDELVNAFKLLVENYNQYTEKASNAQIIAGKYSIQEHVKTFISIIHKCL